MISIIDYNAGNLTSVKRALDYLGMPSRITPDPGEVLSAQRVIFPGVGHAAASMECIRSRGLDQALREAFERGTPILGICLGTQIVLSHSEEGDTQCVGLLEGETRTFTLRDPRLKIPHMGWDRIRVLRPHPVLQGIRAENEFYFVHSFFPRPALDEQVIATCEYEVEFPAVIASGSLIASQFHPEKSGKAGLRLLKNFCTWEGEGC